MIAILNGLLYGRRVEFINSAGKGETENEVYITVNVLGKSFIIRLCREAQQCQKINVLLIKAIYACMLS